MIETNRTGESGRPPIRRHRLIFKEGHWYYKTREAIDIGPFKDRESAEFSAITFILFAKTTGPSVVKLLGLYDAPVISAFLSDSFGAHTQRDNYLM